MFGIELGKPLAVPECSRMKSGKDFFYRGNDQAACFERIGATLHGELWAASVSNDTVYIRFPFNRRPPLCSGQKIVATLVNGNLESIGFNRGGLARQDEVLASTRIA